MAVITEPFVDGRVAIATGAATGVGREIARSLVQRGSRAVLADVSGVAAEVGGGRYT